MSALLASTDIQELPVTISRVFELAREHYGEAPLEKIELKDERGTLIYKIVKGGGEEIRIDAYSGEVFSKYGMSLSGSGKSKAGFNWGKLIDDIHTGKIFGFLGQLMVDFTSVVIMALTATGIYIWAKPILIKRRKALNRQVVVPAQPAKANVPVEQDLVS